MSQICALVISVVAMDANAADWSASRGITVGSYVTDNVCLSAIEEESEVVATVRPAVSLAGSGARASLNLQAAAEYNSLADQNIECPQDSQAINLGNREPWVPSVNFGAYLEAIENWLTLDASAVATQNAANPFQPGGDDNANGLGNTNITYQWGAGATVERGLSRRANLLLRYGYNEQVNSVNQGFAGSQQEILILDLGMDPNSSKLTLGVRGQYSEVDFDATPGRDAFTNRIARASVYASLRLAQSTFLEGSYGKEDNVFLSTIEDSDDSFWDAGLRWVPNARVSVDAGYGERFFGNTPRFSIRYRHKRSSLTASYLKDIQFPRDIRVGPSRNVDADTELFPEQDLVPGVPIGSDGSPTFVGTSPVLNESFGLSYSLSGRRSELRLSASDSRQTQLSTGFTGRFQNVSANFGRQLSSTLSGSLIATFGSGQRGAFSPIESTDRGFDSWRLDLGLSRPLGRFTKASLRYSYYEQQQQSVTDSIAEQRIVLSISYQL